MFISPSGGTHHLKTTELQGTAKTAPITERESKRYQYLFQSPSPQKNKTIYQHVVRLVNQFVNQLMGRQQEGQKEPEQPRENTQNGKARQVRGIADRMPRLVDPQNPQPRRDSVFIGEARDYPAAVIAIEYDDDTHPVFYEGNQIVARHLNLNSEEATIDGKLILNDGSRMPIEIVVFTAV